MFLIVVQMPYCRMLVMERLRGVPLTDLRAIRSITNADPETVLVNALNVWFGSVLACETFHADMHAGGPIPILSTPVYTLEQRIMEWTLH